MDRPNARRVQLDFFYDYRTNVGLYPKWQAFLREKKPNTIIFWGQDDIFLTREGGECYLEDLPNAEMHRLSSGHFAVEDNLDYIAKNMKRFYQRQTHSVTGGTTLILRKHATAKALKLLSRGLFLKGHA